jgi:F0F1-type ATP synthase membrane subunit c/vacuolar-type H+-ATPase subunit K
MKQHDTVSAITCNNNSNNSNANADSSLVEPLLLGGSLDAQSKNTETRKAFPEPNIHFCMTLVYLEAIGLYGLIVALLLISF